MSKVTLTYYTHRTNPNDPEGDLIHSTHRMEVEESEAPAKVRQFFNSDGSMSAHMPDIRRWAPDLLQG